MVNSRRKGYRTENKVRKLFEAWGWRIVRSGASLGEADLICLKGGKCFMLQIKSTAKRRFYFNEYMEPHLEGHPFYLLVDFGRSEMRIMPPRNVVTPESGEHVEEFLKRKDVRRSH